MSGAGALGFRDFRGLLAAKENRTGSRQTLLPILLCWGRHRIQSRWWSRFRGHRDEIAQLSKQTSIDEVAQTIKKSLQAG